MIKKKMIWLIVADYWGDLLESKLCLTYEQSFNLVFLIAKEIIKVECELTKIML